MGCRALETIPDITRRTVSALGFVWIIVALDTREAGVAQAVVLCTSLTIASKARRAGTACEVSIWEIVTVNSEVAGRGGTGWGVACHAVTNQKTRALSTGEGAILVWLTLHSDMTGSSITGIWVADDAISHHPKRTKITAKSHVASVALDVRIAWIGITGVHWFTVYSISCHSCRTT